MEKEIKMNWNKITFGLTIAVLAGLLSWGVCYGETNLHTYPGNDNDICYTDILDSYPEAYEALCGTSPDAKVMNDSLAKD
jgi:hypothetical protein